MGVSVLTTAMAIAAAPVTGGGLPSPIASSTVASTALEYAQTGAESAGTSVEASPPVVPAQPEEPSQPADPTSPAGEAQQPNSGLSAQPESEVLPPAMGQSDIVVTGRRPSPDDPLEELNATSYEVT